ncbi:MAG: toll/interleukin-1 receptor domain-containing protein [Myroides sp.]
MKAFISYSHKDQTYLERLKVHLAQIRREGLISDWTDKEIHVGENLDNVIAKELGSSQLFIALLSPDYIHSDYCYNNEFKAAQEMQKNGKLIIVPIIVEPCDWQKTPFGNLKALPKDGKSVSEWTNPNNAFLNVTDELRRLVSVTGPSVTAENITIPTEEKLARNYKVKKYFSEVDKFNFKEKGFDEIKDYFRSSVTELNFVDNLQARFITDNSEYFTCLISNRANNKDCFVTIKMLKEGQHHFADLTYSFTEKVNSNSMQMDKVYNVENGEYDQFWSKASSAFNRLSKGDQHFSANQVAEEIWNDFISQVGVSID